MNMTTTTKTTTDAQFEAVSEKQPVWKSMVKMARKQPVGVAGPGVVMLMIFAAIFAPFLTPYDPVNNQYEFILTPPGAEFWHGTDQFGRDILTRIIYGARTALFVGFVAASDRGRPRPAAWGCIPFLLRCV